MKVNNVKSMKTVGKCLLGVIGLGVTALTILNAKVNISQMEIKSRRRCVL